ncbi:unnamed protein product [Cuscuta europaea]|nr:unnamed protein product [Cuscuta europaea]
MDLALAGEKRLLQLNELEEFRLAAYDSSKLYKERTKVLHDRVISRRKFERGDKVLLFNSRYKFFPGKLKTRWLGPFEVLEAFPSGAVQLLNKSGQKLMVNGQRLKLYHDGERQEATSVYCLTDPKYE